MPIKKISAKPSHNRPDLVKILVKELQVAGESSSPDTPNIYQEELRYTDSLQVTVVWNRWSEVPVEDRAEIILDAYHDAGMDDEMRRITVALGVTPEEAAVLGRP
jgi:hypothetical protein